jgi:hypothetical protein
MVKDIKGNKELGDGAKINFLGKDFSLAELRQLGIDDPDAIAMRGKILENNQKAMKASGKMLPMVLVPHHQIRIWRTDRIRDINTGILEDIKVFPVQPNNGSRDILGVKFDYSFEQGYTSFTLTFNNARGKNKSRFASGDLVEVYFRLVTEDELRSLETSGSLYQKNKESIKGMPLCFTGVLDKYTARQSPDGLTIEWAGRSGGYILAERNVSMTFPKDSKDNKNGLMSYEEILWEIITKKTGLVMGEIDLGMTKGRTAEGKELTFENGMDLLSPDVEQENTKTFGEDFLKEVEAILLKHPYCCFEEQSSKKAEFNSKQDTGQKKQPRWSCLLEYDLLHPEFFSKAEVESGDESIIGDYKIPLGGSKTENAAKGINGAEATKDSGSINEKIRFKTEWARDLYKLQHDRVTKNRNIIANSAEIRAQYDLKNSAFQWVEIGSDWIYENQNATFERLFKETYGRATKNETEFDAWVAEIEKINKMPTQGFWAWLFGGGEEKTEQQKATRDKCAQERNWYVRWRPGQPFKVGDYVVTPRPNKEENTRKKYYVKDGVLNAPEQGKDPEKVMDIYTVYSYSASDNPNYKVQIDYAGDDNFVRVNVYTTDSLKGRVFQSVPNRVDAIAQAIENLAPLEVVIAEAGTKDLGQKVKEETYVLDAQSDDTAVWTKAELTKATCETNGQIVQEINKILKKFFSCVFFVDEYGIGHIRPRYKNVQKKEEGTKTTPPVWGLYAGQPIYPRLFETEISDNLKSTPSSVIVHGQVNADGAGVFAKVDHAILMGLFGEQQRFEEVNQSVNSRIEAKNIAKNKLLDMARNALTFACQCDLIPELRPGHRVDIVDAATGVVGRFLAESIQWEYSKDTGTKMSVGLSFCEFASEDAFTSSAIVSSKKLSENYGKQLSENINARKSLFGFPLLRESSLETGKDEESLKNINAEFADKVLPQFNLGKDGGVIQFIPREGFETPTNKDGTGGVKK